MKKYCLFCAVLSALSVSAADWHVAVSGNDRDKGGQSSPFRTIQRAADVAQPGDVITVHGGVYRERVNPPRGGESDAKRIVYQAAPGEKVAIKGSEVVKGWERVEDDVWNVTLPGAFFGGFNPFDDLIRGDWFNPKGRAHHTGAVYLNGEWLAEAAKLEEVLGKAPAARPAARSGHVLLNVAWLRVCQEGASGRIPAAGFAAAQQGVRKAPCEEGGECIGWIEDGDWVRYDGVSFGERVESVELRVASATAGGLIELRLGAPDGELLGAAAVPHTGGWQAWTSVTAKIGAAGCAKSLCLVFRAPDAQPAAPLWFARVEGGQTTVWAQFKGVNPNEQLVEVNARRTVFYPDKPGRNFITVRGFTMCEAATPWAPPTAEQVGLIGTHWSKGWVIENNVISHSICSGIALGKHGDAFDNTSANTAEGYVKTIERAHAHAIAWTRENIGHHVVRSNRISHCEQAGIVGSLGCAFSTVTGNDIHDIHVRKLFTGAEMAGIKFHAAIDAEISGNHIYRTCRGLWLDWMAQGTHVTRNLFHDNASEDVFVEVNHGPFLFDNNLLLSRVSLLDVSEGGAYAHNLLAGRIVSSPEPRRETPFHPAHATAVAGLSSIKGGDDRFYNNIFIGPEKGDGYGLCVYNAREYPLLTGGNVYLNCARPYSNETAQTVLEGAGTRAKVESTGEGVFLMISPYPALSEVKSRPVNTESLGKARIPQIRYEKPDGSQLSVDGDYFSKRRDAGRPTPGPFEAQGAGELKMKVW